MPGAFLSTLSSLLFRLCFKKGVLNYILVKYFVFKMNFQSHKYTPYSCPTIFTLNDLVLANLDKMSSWVFFSLGTRNISNVLNFSNISLSKKTCHCTNGSLVRDYSLICEITLDQCACMYEANDLDVFGYLDVLMMITLMLYEEGGYIFLTLLWCLINWIYPKPHQL